jgi:hypothetical protein
MFVFTALGANTFIGAGVLSPHFLDSSAVNMPVGTAMMA